MLRFEDSIGNKISNEETSINVKECGNGLTNTTIFLTKSFNRVDMDETYYCKIKHENRTTPYSIELEKVNVLRKLLFIVFFLTFFVSEVQCSIFVFNFLIELRCCI